MKTILNLIIVGLLGLMVTACAETRMGKPLPSGAVVNMAHTSSAGTVDGVNGNLAEIMVPKLDKYGDPIKSIDPKTGKERIEYDRTEYKFVADEPITGEMLKQLTGAGADVLTAGGTIAINKAINGKSCNGSGCGGNGVQVNNLNYNLANAESNAVLSGGCPTGNCGLQ